MRRVASGFMGMEMSVPQRVEVVGGSNVKITWDDGREDELSATTLREVCPCAECREPEGLRRTAEIISGDSSVEIVDARVVGGYALSFTFSPDAHQTGIYPFDALRRLGDA